MKQKKRFYFIAGLAVLLVCVLFSLYFSSNLEKGSLDKATRAQLPGKFIALSNGVVHYELAGAEDAPLVVLVHGFSVPYYVWDPTFEALVNAGFRVLRYDLFGRGYSDRPDAEYDLDLFVIQLDELITGLQIQQPVHLVGLSMGGPIVAAYANRNPSNVNSISFIAPEVKPVSNTDIFPMNLPLVGEYVVMTYLAPIMLPQSQPDDFFKPELFPDWESKYRDQLQYKGFRRAILSTIRNLAKTDSIAEYEGVERLQKPVLLVWGREDQTIPIGDVELAQSLIPEMEFMPIDNAGHLPHYEQPEVVNPLLIAFFKKHSQNPN